MFNSSGIKFPKKKSFKFEKFVATTIYKLYCHDVAISSEKIHRYPNQYLKLRLNQITGYMNYV